MLNKQQRFYDQDPLVRESIAQTEAFPVTIRALVARCLNRMAVDYFQADSRLNQLKSLGPEVVLQLYKSKHKRRQSDTIAECHAAINYLRVLQPGERVVVAERLIPFNRLVGDYLEQCTFTAFLPDPAKLESIFQAILPLGAEQAKTHLEAVRQELLTVGTVGAVPTGKSLYIAGGSSIHLGEF